MSFFTQYPKKYPKIESTRVDDEGRSLIVVATIQGVPFLLINVYAPNSTSKQSSFFQTLADSVYDNDYHEDNHRLLIGGDFNVAIQPALDCSGGNATLKESVKFLEDIMMEHDLVDIWRVRNLYRKNFTWHQKNPLIQRRLDYWLISDLLQDDVSKTHIVSAIKTCHAAVVLEIDSLANLPRS